MDTKAFMKNYLPVVVGIAVIIAGGLIIRQYSARNAVDTKTQESAAQTAPTEESAITPTTATKEALTVTSGITLTISSPSNNTTVSGSSLTVKGKTVAGAEVFVNDSETKADAGGNFSVKITLEEGENYILVVANDAAGNYSEKELSITYTP